MNGPTTPTGVLTASSGTGIGSMRMGMRRRFAALSVLAIFHTWALVPSISAQPASSQSTAQNLQNWESVKRVGRDTKIRVTERSGAATIGSFQSASDSHVDVLTIGGAVQIARDEIYRVERMSAEGRARGAKIGFVIGAVAGATLGAATTKSNRVPWAVTLGAGWGGVGALIGAVSSKRQHQRPVLIYQKTLTTRESEEVQKIHAALPRLGSSATDSEYSREQLTRIRMILVSGRAHAWDFRKVCVSRDGE